MTEEQDRAAMKSALEQTVHKMPLECIAFSQGFYKGLSYAREQDAPGLSSKQEPKYTVNGRAIVNRSSGEEIPADEPVFILRGRDVHAANAIDYYSRLVTDKSHEAVVDARYRDFLLFKRRHPERMKEPDSAAGIHFKQEDSTHGDD